MIETNEIRVVIIGAGKGGTSILKVLLALDNIKILGLAEISPQAPGLKIAREKGIPIIKDFAQLLAVEHVDVIIEATGKPEIQAKIRKHKDPHAAIMEAQAAHLMMNLVRKQEELLHVKELQEQLSAILNSAQEGIQVVDGEGNVLYVNRAFSRITRVSPRERIGKNVFEVSPMGALVEVIKTKKTVFGKINSIKGTGIEVISNASPILVDNNMVGAVVVFRDISDYKKLAKKLAESKEVIDGLKEEISQLVSARYTFEDILGNNVKFCQCIKVAKQAAENSSTVLITGESGTGKEYFAHAIHNYGPRKHGPFVKVNCAAIPDNLLESELFGYEKGAFTGAQKSKIGKFELAHGGTIFLDEIGDMSFILQAKLLRVLQEKEVEPLGSNRHRKVDVRIIAATHHDLLKHVEQGNFRPDLYYRLNVIHVNIPPLRERMDDLQPLASHTIRKMNKRHSKNCSLDNNTKEILYLYNWPGNVRELENLLERAVVLSEGQTIYSELIGNYIKPIPSAHPDDLISLEEMEKQMIIKGLEKYGASLVGKKNTAAKLGISLATLYNKLEKYKISNLN